MKPMHGASTILVGPINVPSPDNPEQTIRATGLRMECKIAGCDYSQTIPEYSNKPANPVFAKRKFDVAGWDVERGCCPNHNRRNRRKSTADHVGTSAAAQRNAAYAARAEPINVAGEVSRAALNAPSAKPGPRQVYVGTLAEAIEAVQKTGEGFVKMEVRKDDGSWEPVGDPIHVPADLMRTPIYGTGDGPAVDVLKALEQVAAQIQKESPVPTAPKQPLLNTGRTLTVAEREAARVFLDCEFDSHAGSYSPGWSDQRVADEMNEALKDKSPGSVVGVADVARYREAAFGPLLSSPELEQLKLIVHGAQGIVDGKIKELKDRLQMLDDAHKGFMETRKREFLAQQEKDRTEWKEARAAFRLELDTLAAGMATTQTKVDEYAKSKGIRL